METIMYIALTITAMICEYSGIDEAMKYYEGTHPEDEYQEYRTSTILTD